MQNITQSWFVQGMIKATTDAWLKGWDERNGGNLTLRLDDADIAPYHDNFHAQPRLYPAQPAHAFTGKYTVYCHRLRQILPQRPA